MPYFGKRTNYKVHVFGFCGPISYQTGICSIPEKEAAGWPLLPDYGHYMGFNFGVFFFKTGREYRPDLLPVESDGFTGVFLGDP